MDLLTSARQAAVLDRLAALEVADGQLLAARARALVDYDELCRAQPVADRAVEFTSPWTSPWRARSRRSPPPSDSSRPAG